jgi:hypothetical protein
MVSRRPIAGLVVAAFSCAAAFAASPVAPVAGVVRHMSVPIPGAIVFVYGISDARLSKVRTATDGSFAFDDVPPGVYDVVAYKSGYYPSLIRLWHQATPAVSSIAIDLLPAGRTSGPADVWSWRDRLPADVLREITGETREPGRSRPSDGIVLSKFFNGELSATTSTGGGDSYQRSQIDLFGELPGSAQYALRGSYAALSGKSDSPLASGAARDASLTVATSPDTAFAVQYAGRSFDSADGPGPRLDRESVRWNTQDDTAGSRIEASLMRSSETGFERATSVAPDLLPLASDGYELSGRWTVDHPETRYGVSLHVYQREFRGLGEERAPSGRIMDASLSGAGERSLTSWISVGTTLLAQLHESESFVAPGALVRFRLGPKSSLLLSASRRLSSNQSFAGEPALIVSENGYESAISQEASAVLSIGGESSPARLEVAASTQTAAAPVRVYFDSDLLLDFGSVYLFDGNRLQKLSATASARIFDVLDAAISAEGGEIRGRVSGDTRQKLAIVDAQGRYYGGQASVMIRPTHTDVTCALRRIRQILQSETGMANNSSDKLRFAIGQDLTVFGFDPFGSAWRLVLAYERDSSTLAANSSIEETALLRRRFTGGVSISF